MPHSEDASRRPGILRPESSENSLQCASPSSLLGLNNAISPKATPKCKYYPSKRRCIGHFNMRVAAFIGRPEMFAMRSLIRTIRSGVAKYSRAQLAPARSRRLSVLQPCANMSLTSCHHCTSNGGHIALISWQGEKYRRS